MLLKVLADGWFCLPRRRFQTFIPSISFLVQDYFQQINRSPRINLSMVLGSKAFAGEVFDPGFMNQAKK